MNKQPETLAQAREWDVMRNRYARLGLCNRCGAQAAYGHADGFSTILPPCWECVLAIVALPTEEPNGWRSSSRRQGRPLDALSAVPTAP